MLNINKTLEESKLTVALEGRLDTTTSPELEKSLNDSLPGVTELVISWSTSLPPACVCCCLPRRS